MNFKICKCGKLVWASDRYCESCGTKYEDIDPDHFKRELAKKHPHPYEDFLAGKYEKVGNAEIDEWFAKWENKYVDR